MLYALTWKCLGNVFVLFLAEKSDDDREPVDVRRPRGVVAQGYHMVVVAVVAAMLQGCQIRLGRFPLDVTVASSAFPVGRARPPTKIKEKRIVHVFVDANVDNFK